MAPAMCAIDCLSPEISLTGGDLTSIGRRIYQEGNIIGRCICGGRSSPMLNFQDVTHMTSIRSSEISVLKKFLSGEMSFMKTRCHSPGTVFFAFAVHGSHEDDQLHVPFLIRSRTRTRCICRIGMLERRFHTTYRLTITVLVVVSSVLPVFRPSWCGMVICSNICQPALRGPRHHLHHHGASPERTASTSTSPGGRA
jgi:hypothetical protein